MPLVVVVEFCGLCTLRDTLYNSVQLTFGFFNPAFPIFCYIKHNYKLSLQTIIEWYVKLFGVCDNAWLLIAWWYDIALKCQWVA